MMQLRGHIQKETEKAIYFVVEEDRSGFQLNTYKGWLPKSQIRLPKKRNGLITIYIRCWLYDAKTPKIKYYQ